jgi:hypothetical protein
MFMPPSSSTHFCSTASRKRPGRSHAASLGLGEQARGIVAAALGGARAARGAARVNSCDTQSDTAGASVLKYEPTDEAMTMNR